MKKKNRTFKYDLRLTEEELISFKEKATHHDSVSSMIRKAVEALDHKKEKKKIEVLDEFAELLRSYDNQFSHVTGNLNQVVKRANQLAKVGGLDKNFLEKELYSQIINVNKNILAIKKMQKSIYSQLLNME